MEGWISLHRKIWKHDFFQEKRKFSRLEAWIDILLLASHLDHEIQFDNETIEVKRGSFVTSKRKLAERWGWSNTKLNAFFKYLNDEKMCITKSTTKKTTVYVLNYETHQGFERFSENEKHHQKNHKKHTINNGINNNNKNIVHSDERFEQWWNLYGNKKGRAKCEPKFKRLLKTYSFETIMDGTKKYLQYREDLAKRNEFVPQQKNPLTFLNGEHFNDEYETQNSSQPLQTENGPQYKSFNFDFSKGEDE